MAALVSRLHCGPGAALSGPTSKRGIGAALSSLAGRPLQQQPAQQTYRRRSAPPPAAMFARLQQALSGVRLPCR